MAMTMTTDYQAYLETAWQWLNYLPYLLVAYVLLTLVPKSLMRMKRYADADFEANRHKFHRCYGPELCCHAHASVQAQELPAKQAKQRKPVTRVYPKRQQPLNKPELPSIKHNHVTNIARMFESGNATRQVSRVTPVTLPDIRSLGASEGSSETTPCVSRKGSIATQMQHIEHAMQLWQELQDQQQQQQQQPQKSSRLNDWEPMTAMPVPAIRRSLGTSATPSTASPLCSSPEPPSPVLLREPPALCLKSSMEDIFQAIARSAEEPVDCNSLSPITCIDDILSERRFSRPLSAYSITDLLNEEQESLFVNETTLQQLETS
ncbi:uncharacterized protein LOC108650731 isoform X2 [Drosophila navojoa]|uniref:uncharacterized protein LOC108650731 isoform X2 n=1 Tax=Drosophila navojoa TaxID=7232 RepID=UPI0008475795|nr:uncharacterized protein LOC108650731 isoform X2 [Drosophila navojoa]